MSATTAGGNGPAASDHTRKRHRIEPPGASRRLRLLSDHPLGQPIQAEQREADRGEGEWTRWRDHASVADVLALKPLENLPVMELRIGLHSELSAEPQHTVLTLADPRAADRHGGAVVHLALPDAPAYPVPRLQDAHVQPGVLQPAGRRDAREPGTDHARMRVHRSQATPSSR